MEHRIVITFLLTALSTLRGQPASPPAFEAASIKPSAPGRVGGGLNVSAGRIKVINSSLKFCIEVAWDVKDFQVSGAAGWMDSDHYDIDAVSAAPFKKGEYRAMLQTLLTERFGLVIHRDTQEKSGYALVVARGGPKLPPPVDDPDILFSWTPSGERTLKAKNVTLNDLAQALSSTLSAAVIDRTGIEGRFDVSLQWTPDAGQPMISKTGVPFPPPPPDAVQSPGLFTVLQDRLGLKLEARKVPVEVIVVDRAQRPSGN